MRRTETNLLALTCLFVGALLTANVLASKVIAIGPFELPCAVVAYPLTFLITDVIGEIWGRRQANLTVRIGFVCQVVSLIMIYVAICLPPASYMGDYQEEFAGVLGSTGRMVAASLVAYLASQTWDVFVFHTLKDHPVAGKKKWVRNNLSTASAQLIDTAIFITIGFWGTVPDIALMIVSQYAVKLVIALCDTPFFYWLTREERGGAETARRHWTGPPS